MSTHCLNDKQTFQHWNNFGNKIFRHAWKFSCCCQFKKHRVKFYACVSCEHKEITGISFSLLFSFYDNNIARKTCESFFIKAFDFRLLKKKKKTFQFSFHSRIFFYLFLQSSLSICCFRDDTSGVDVTAGYDCKLKWTKLLF